MTFSKFFFASFAISLAAATSLPAFASVSVSSPYNGEQVGSPFTLSASASACSDQAISAMGYSFDSSSDTTIVDSTSINTSVQASAGAHTLHVKSWGDQGASCVTDVAITVTATTSTTSVSVSSPSNGEQVSSPFTLSASASDCSDQAINAMGYSLDSSSDTTIVDSTSINTTVQASAGAHTLHVKSWGDGGASCVTNVAVTVTGTTTATTNSSVVPSGATSVSSVQVLGSWVAEHDTGTSGSSSGAMALVNSPSLSGNAREFYTTYSGYGGERYHVSFSDNTSSTNFLYDGWVYLTSSISSIANLEMDLNQVMANGQTAIFGFQCDGYSGTWDYTENEGTPTSPTDAWVHTGAACNVRKWATNTWHHVQISYSRTSSGVVTYQSVWLDGTQAPINATVPSAFALGWGPTILTNLQVDGLGSGSSTVYLDKLTVYSW